MAGYMKRLNGYVYDGHHVAGEELTSGLFVTLNANNKVVKTTAAVTDLKLDVVDKKEQWGKYFIAANVIDNAATNVYFTELEWNVDDDLPYDETEYSVKVGQYVKMRVPAHNDQCFFSVNKTLYDALTIHDIVTPAAGGTVAKAT